jgi:curli biogenesis system outer membrane secretion channel CsgG
MSALATVAFVLVLFEVQSPADSVQKQDDPTAVPRAAELEGDIDSDAALLKVRRIFVEDFGDDAVSKQIHGMLVTGLTDSKRFVVTDNRDRADAVLKGTAVETVSQELFTYGEGTSTGRRGPAIEDSATKTQTVHNARLAVRLVNRDGDVLWASSQESKGAKYKGASADVADKIVKQLLRDLQRIQKARSSTPPAS